VAEPHRLRRKDLKRPDEFVTVTAQAIAWARANQRIVTLLGLGALAVVVGISVAVGVRSARQRDANADLAGAWARFRDTKGEGGAAQLAEVGRRWSGTGAGTVAKLLAASAELRGDNAESALLQVQELLTQADLASYLRQEALVAYGFALEQKKQSDQAIAKYAEAAQLSGPYTIEALLAEARLRVAAGQKEQARALYERVQKDFPEAANREQLDAKLAALN
jgi:tetratricopeptide (TPR) repeat protein